MKLHFIGLSVALALAGLGVVACSSSDEVEPTPQRTPLSISASLSTPATRISMADKGASMSVTWTNTDTLYLYNTTSANPAQAASLHYSQLEQGNAQLAYFVGEGIEGFAPGASIRGYVVPSLKAPASKVPVSLYLQSGKATDHYTSNYDEEGVEYSFDCKGLYSNFIATGQSHIGGQRGQGHIDLHNRLNITRIKFPPFQDSKEQLFYIRVRIPKSSPHAFATEAEYDLHADTFKVTKYYKDLYINSVVTSPTTGHNYAFITMLPNQTPIENITYEMYTLHPDFDDRGYQTNFIKRYRFTITQGQIFEAGKKTLISSNNVGIVRSENKYLDNPAERNMHFWARAWGIREAYIQYYWGWTGFSTTEPEDPAP